MSDIRLPEGEFHAVIFDCDGTLADSMPLHFRAWKYAFERHQAKFVFTWELFYSMAGVGMRDSVVQLNERYQDILDADAVVESNHEFFSREHANINPIPQVVEIARALKEKGIPIAVASGGDPRHVHGTLHYCGIDHLFDVVVTKADVVHSKPAPDGFLKAAELLGVDPKMCIVYEDSQLGLTAAEAAGMRWVYVDPDVYSAGAGC